MVYNFVDSCSVVKSIFGMFGLCYRDRVIVEEDE